MGMIVIWNKMTRAEAEGTLLGVEALKCAAEKCVLKPSRKYFERGLTNANKYSYTIADE